MRRPNYVPRLRSKQELQREVAYKRSWRTPGTVNKYFMPLDLPKAKILDPWTASRVNQPERAYEKQFICKFF